MTTFDRISRLEVTTAAQVSSAEDSSAKTENPRLVRSKGNVDRTRRLCIQDVMKKGIALIAGRAVLASRTQLVALGLSDSYTVQWRTTLQSLETDGVFQMVVVNDYVTISRQRLTLFF